MTKENLEIYNIVQTIQKGNYISKDKMEILKYKVIYVVSKIMKRYLQNEIIDEVMSELYLYLVTHNDVILPQYFNRSFRFLMIDILKKLKLLSRQNYLDKLKEKKGERK